MRVVPCTPSHLKTPPSLPESLADKGGPSKLPSTAEEGRPRTGKGGWEGRTQVKGRSNRGKVGAKQGTVRAKRGCREEMAQGEI